MVGSGVPHFAPTAYAPTASRTEFANQRLPIPASRHAPLLLTAVSSRVRSNSMKRAPVPSSQHKYCADEMWRSVGHAPASPMQGGVAFCMLLGGRCGALHGPQRLPVVAATARSTELRFYQVPVKLATAVRGGVILAECAHPQAGSQPRPAPWGTQTPGPGQYATTSQFEIALSKGAGVS